MAIALDAFLQTLADEGRKDSSGTFTLDSAQAREKLRRYQLSYPYAFVGALMAAAYHARVSIVTLTLTPSEFRLHWPARTLPQGDEFLQHLLRADSPRYLQELALGLNAALAMRPRRLWADSGVVRRIFEADREQTESISPVPGLEIGLEYDRFSRLQRSLARVLPEERLVRNWCGLAAPQVNLNGQLLTPQKPRGRCLATAVLNGGPERFVAQMRDQLPPSDLHLELDGPGPHGGVLAIFHEVDEEVALVVDGLTFRLPETGVSGAWGLLMVPQLQRDLSAFSLVQNAEYQAVVDSLSDALHALLEALGDQLDRLDKGGKQLAAHILVSLGHARSSRGRRSEAQRFYLEVVQACDALQTYPLAYFEAAYALFVMYRGDDGRLDYHSRRFFEDFAGKVRRRFKPVTISMPAFYPGMMVLCPDESENVKAFTELVQRVDRLLGEQRTHFMRYPSIRGLIQAMLAPFQRKE